MPVHSDSGIAAATLPVLLAGLIGLGCAGRPPRVSPAEIPTLEAELQRQPGNGELLLRYSAALYAAERCDSAMVVAGRGRAVRPADPLGPLVVGRCQERQGRYDEAIATYQGFLDQHGAVSGAAAVEGQALLARRQRARRAAAQALAREADLPPAETENLAVLPVVVEGDSALQPLSQGLSALIISDLSLLGRFRLVERVQLNLILQELQRQQQLRETGMLDESTAARVGRLARAGRLVQGLLIVPDEDDVRLEANLVEEGGEVAGTPAARGRLKRLLRMEKDVVLGVVRQLGVELSVAERRRILENGTESLVAFLAYSRGLVEEDRGNYAAAARHYAEAARADPTFDEARQRRDAATGADVALRATPGAITTVPVRTQSAVDLASAPVGVNVLDGVVGEVAVTQAEAASSTLSISSTTNAVRTPTSVSPPSGVVTETLIRIIVRLPL